MRCVRVGVPLMPTAAEYAAEQVASVSEDPAARLALLRSLYEAPPGSPERHLPYRRAALACRARRAAKRRCSHVRLGQHRRRAPEPGAKADGRVARRVLPPRNFAT